jgi:hypothetical protein
MSKMMGRRPSFLLKGLYIMTIAAEAANLIETTLASEVTGVPEVVAKDAAAIVGLEFEVSPDHAALFTGPSVVVNPVRGTSEMVSAYMGPIVSAIK